MSIKKCCICGLLFEAKRSSITCSEVCSYERHRQRNSVHSRKWRLANLEKDAENHRKWRLANPEKMAENHRKWRLANPEKYAENHRKWRLENPEKVTEYYRKHRRMKSYRLTAAKILYGEIQ